MLQVLRRIMSFAPARGPAVRRVALAVCVLAGWACTGSGEGIPDKELGNLVVVPQAGEPAVDPKRAGHDASELVRAALTTHGRAGQALGSHRFHGKSTMEVREAGQVVEALTVETTMEFDASGAFHAVSQNSRDYGREVFYQDGFLYLAPRYSKFHRRPPETRDEPAAIRNDLFAELGAHLELVGRHILVTERAVDTVAGRNARVIRVTRADSAKTPARAEPPERAWRNDIAVDTMEGEIALDSDTGVPLRGSLRGTLSFTRDGRAFVMTFTVEHSISAIGESVAITPPAADQWVATPLRVREAEERDLLLRGIAPPSRKPSKAGSGDSP